MTNQFYGIFIGVNKDMDGRSPAVRREGRPGHVQGYVAGRAETQRYAPDDEAAKRLKNMLSGEMHDE